MAKMKLVIMCYNFNSGSNHYQEELVAVAYHYRFVTIYLLDCANWLAGFAVTRSFAAPMIVTNFTLEEKILCFSFFYFFPQIQ